MDLHLGIYKITHYNFYVGSQIRLQIIRNRKFTVKKRNFDNIPLIITQL